LGRELRSGGPRTTPGKQGFSRDFLIGKGIPRGSGFAGLRQAATTTRRVVAIQEELSLFGRADLNSVIDDVARLDRQGKVQGFDEWVKGAHTETPQGMVNHTSELLETRRLQAEVAASGNPNTVIRIGQDRATKNRSFDISVEQTSPGVPPVTTRRVEVFTENATVEGSRSLSQGIAHGAKKAYPHSVPPPAPGTRMPVSTPPGMREATVRVKWPPPPLQRRGGAQQVFNPDGSSHMLLGDGSTRPMKTNIFDDLLNDLNGNAMGNPRVDYLHAVNIIDEQGNLVGRVVNNGNPDLGIGTWSR
jgi:hypothetical protein